MTLGDMLARLHAWLMLAEATQALHEDAVPLVFHDLAATLAAHVKRVRYAGCKPLGIHVVTYARRTKSP